MLNRQTCPIAYMNSIWTCIVYSMTKIGYIWSDMIGGT